jgi:hypothetical protein
MQEPENHPDPYSCIFGRPQETPPFRPIVTFMRKPGMSVRWDDSTESRGWAGGLSGLPDGRYLIAVFVPEQERSLIVGIRNALGTSASTLESYLRGCERSDHNTWSDVSGQSIISRIRQSCGKILKDIGSVPVPVSPGAQPMKMARNFADLLLPQRGFGIDGRNGSPSKAQPRSQKNSSARERSDGPAINVEKVEYLSEGLRVHWTLQWGSASNAIPRAITVEVDSESATISNEEWRTDGLGNFPFGLDAFRVEEPASSIELRPGGEGSVTLLATRSLRSATLLRGTLNITLKTAAASSLRPVISASLCQPKGSAE